MKNAARSSGARRWDIDDPNAFSIHSHDYVPDTICVPLKWSPDSWSHDQRLGYHVINARTISWSVFGIVGTCIWHVRFGTWVTARARPGHVISRCQYMIVGGTDSLTHGCTHALFSGTWRAINAILVKNTKSCIYYSLIILLPQVCPVRCCV